MIYYHVYDVDSTNRALDSYNKIAASTPTYSDSAETVNARNQANAYAKSYQNKINSGYQSNYSSAINNLADKYMNNEFEWSADTSADYQQYADKYKREGKTAQENIQGAYSANTGGYSNSYAQAAGQKAYGQYMDELAEKIPTLRNNAYKSWQDQQEDTINKISTLQGLDDTQYQRYRDSVNDDYDFMTYYENKYATSKGLDMSQFQNELAVWQSRMSAAQSNLSDMRNLAEQQFEHKTVSADTQASVNSSRAQTDAYYKYLYSQLK